MKFRKTATKVCRNECLSPARVFERLKCFQDGREDAEGDEHLGGTSVSKTDDKIRKIRNLIRFDHRLSICPIAKMVGIDKECVGPNCLRTSHSLSTKTMRQLIPRCLSRGF